jgi:toxin-antitoxin system PIN domain toxin
VFVVDTNVLVYAADEDSPFHAACRSRVEQWRAQSGAWYSTWSILYEFLRVTTHPRVFRNPWSAAQAWDFAQALLAAPGLAVLTAGERHRAVLAEVIDEHPALRGNVMHDAQTAVLMREHGIRRIYTRDTDFHRFRFLEPIDPVA